MPNHVINYLVVDGPREEVQTFMQAVKGSGDFDCNKIIPYPERFQEMDRAKAQWEKDNPCKSGGPLDGFNSGGYEWCIRHWGTKWGAYESKLIYEDLESEYFSSVEYRFKSAWSPPLPVIRAAWEKFPKLSFELNYFECGCEFRGTYGTRAPDDDRQEREIFDERGSYVGRMGG